MLFYKFEKYICIESRSDEYVVLRKSGRSGGISWYGWMAILVVQLNRSNTDLKTVWKTISTYEGWLTSTLRRQASMLFCSAVKIHLYDYVVTIIGVTLTTSMLAHIIHRLLRNSA